jgi:hypothetical protein
VQPPSVEPPAPPKGTTLFLQTEKGRPAAATEAFIWTWEGAPRWYYVHEHAILAGHPVDATRW